MVHAAQYANEDGQLDSYVFWDALEKAYGFDRTTLTEVPFTIDLEGVNSIPYLFGDLTSLKKAPKLDLDGVRDLTGLFSFCESLAEVPDLHVDGELYMQGIFLGCASLKDGSVRIILGDNARVADDRDMIQRSGLTRVPFYDRAGNPV